MRRTGQTVTEALALAPVLAGVLAVAALLSSLLSSLLYRPFRRVLNTFGPRTRAAATLGFALVAPTVVLLALLVHTGPGTAQWLPFDHCHENQCGAHTPLLADDSLGSIGLVAGALLMMLCLAAGVYKALVAGRRQLRTLFNLGDQSQDYLIIDSDHLLAWCCGLLNPKVVLSRGLLRTLDADQIRVVLAHERAHVRRRDNLRNVLARWSTCLWLPAPRRQLCADLAADAEVCCDAIAWRSAPASFRRAVENMAAQPHAGFAGRHVHFGTTQTEQRIALASFQGTQPPVLAYLLVVTVWTLQTLLVGSVVHPVVEIIAATGA